MGISCSGSAIIRGSWEELAVVRTAFRGCGEDGGGDCRSVHLLRRAKHRAKSVLFYDDLHCPFSQSPKMKLTTGVTALALAAAAHAATYTVCPMRAGVDV